MKLQTRVNAALVVGWSGLIFVVLLLAAFVARSAGENILLNPGFEEDDMSMWEIWFPESHSRPRRVSLPYDGIYFPHLDNIDNEIRGFGDYAVAWTPSTSMGAMDFSQFVTIETSGYYDFSFSYFVIPPSDPRAAIQIRHRASFDITIRGPESWIGVEEGQRIGNHFYNPVRTDEPAMLTGGTRAVPLEAGDIVQVRVSVGYFGNEEDAEFIGLVDNVAVVMTREFGAWSRGTFAWLAVGVLIVTVGAVLALTHRPKEASNR